MRYWISCLFVFLLLIPVMFGLVTKGPAAEKTAKSPGFEPEAFKDPEYYTAWQHYFNRKLLNVPPLTAAKNWLDYRVFAMTDTDRVYVGREGWLFENKDMQDYRKAACEQKSLTQQLLLDLQALTSLMKISGKQFIFTVIPNKSTIYPEFVGDMPRSSDCGLNFYDLLIEATNQSPLRSFVRLDDQLNQAKKKGKVLFSKTGVGLNQAGATVASKAILKAIFKNDPPSLSQDDLTSLLLGQEKQLVSAKQRSESDEATGNHATMLVYSGAGIGQLLPMLSQHVDRVDVIVSDTIPSATHGETPSTYETTILAVPESHLPDFRLDLNRLCVMLSADSLAGNKASIPLSTLTAMKYLSLAMEQNNLAVKSLGAESSFKLPALPGSDTQMLRMLKLTIISSRTDRLTWQIENSLIYKGTCHLRPGPTQVYVPLPQNTSVQISIYPGRNTGLFHLTRIELLEFLQDKTSLASQHYKINKVLTNTPEDKDELLNRTAGIKEPSEQNQEIASPTAPEITLTDFQEGRIFQRTGTAADILVSGTFKGNPTAIEAQVLHHDSGQPVTSWTIVDSDPGAGVFMGILPEVPQGGWYRIAVRLKNHPDTQAQGQSRWAVGMLVACLGQSNMKEWFYAGSELSAHSLLSLHRDGQWQPASIGGNGVIAFGNRLIGKLAVPVGLLDYAVNGSGLRKEADWGKGYWADKSEKSIYRQFINGLSAAGGVLEYVVWMQGEADAARDVISESQYRDALKDFINHQLRYDIVNRSQQPNLPILIVGMPKRPVGKDAPHQAVRNAQIAVARELQDCYLAAATLDLTNQGRQHLAPEAYTKLGLRVAQTILYLLGEENYYRGPKVSGAFKIGEDTIDVTILHQGGIDFSPADDITGWSVLHGNDAVAISEVNRQNPQTIRISLKEPIAGPLTLRYLYGAMPDADRAVKDNSAMELPLEAYEGVVQ